MSFREIKELVSSNIDRLFANNSTLYVVGIDKDEKKVQKLNNGVSPLFEPGLEELLANNIKVKRLSFTSDLCHALKGAGYVLMTFDTPVN